MIPSARRLQTCRALLYGLLFCLPTIGAPALAVCESPRLIGLDSYVYTPGVPLGSGHEGSTVSSRFEASFWALGAGDIAPGAGTDNGTWDALYGGWIYTVSGYPAGGTRAGVSRTWGGSSQIDGCIDFVPGDRCMALLLMDQNATAGSFALITAAPDGLGNYDLTPKAQPPGFDTPPVALTPIPPLVLVDIPPFDRVFNGPNLFEIQDGLDLDPGCTQDLVVGFKIYQHVSPPPDLVRDNGDRGSGWELHPDGAGPDGQPLPLGQSVTLSPVCSQGSGYFALSLVFDSGFETGLLSEAVGPFACDCGGTDADGDGYCAAAGTAQTDCDDGDPEVYPGAPQLCDGKNNDCRDPDWPAVPGAEDDADGDGFRVCDDDCDDDSATVFPGAPQLCDGLNNNCDDPFWPSAADEEVDDDGDGFDECSGDCDDRDAATYAGAPETCDGRRNDCDHPEWPAPEPADHDDDGDGTSECAGDCDDTRGTVGPAATQLCGDGLNNDCDHPNWPELTGTIEADDDGDGFNACQGDCDDASATTFPHAPEICDGLNNDCNSPDWPVLPEDEIDYDQDGLSPCAGDCDDHLPRVFPGAPPTCDGLNNDCADPNWPAIPAEDSDDDGDGWKECNGDCDDTRASVFPGAPGVCDGLSNDCTAPHWPLLTATNEADDDGDGVSECLGDSDDARASVFPGAPQICDGFNNDCGDPEWPALPADEADQDGDGVTLCAGDCDDAEATVFPGAAETCDGLNNDCDDPGWPTPPAGDTDADGDGFPACAFDCDDSDPAVYYGAPEVCDGVNNNCGDPRWPGLPPAELDADGDGAAWCFGAVDCNDDSLAAHPGAVEVCDGLDNDCDGEIDELQECAPGRRVLRAGAALSVIQAGSGDSLSLHWTGVDYGLFWDDGGAVYYAAFGADSTLPPRLVAAPVPPATEVAVVWTGARYAVFYVSNRRAYVQFLARDGSPLGAAVTITGSFANSDISVVWNGSGFGLSSTEAYPSNDSVGGYSKTHFRRLDRDGLYRSGIDYLLGYDTRHSTLAWGGGHYAALTALSIESSTCPDRYPFFAQIDREGDLVSLEESPFTCSAQDGLVWTGAGFAGTRTTGVGPDAPYIFSLYAPDGTRLQTDVAVTTALQRSRSNLLWTGSELVTTVWSESGSRLIAFGLDGALTRPPVAFARGGQSRVAWNGRDYGVAVRSPDGTRIRFLRIR